MRQKALLCAQGVLVLFALLSLATASLAADWIENIGVLVRIDSLGSGISHVYDSDDYQRMLLVVDDQASAAVIDLATATVYTIPREGVEFREDGTASSDETTEVYCCPFDQIGATLEFVWESTTIAIEPLPPMIGATDLDQVLAIKPSYAVAASAYEPDSTIIARLREFATPTEIHVYFGTWCHLCKKLVPPLIGTLEKAGNPALRAKYIGVNEELTEPADEIEEDFITTTPTVVLLQGTRELGRIEEEASTSIEADLLELLRGER